ncbi:unnamed protein product [Gadus morhua 'NCC']
MSQGANWADPNVWGWGGPEPEPGGNDPKGAESRPLFPVEFSEEVRRHREVLRGVLRLLKEGADPCAELTSGGTLLHLCARHDNVLRRRSCCSRGLDPDLQDRDLWTALHTACGCDHAEVVLLLLLTGANVLLQDVDGSVALDLAPEGSESRHLVSQHLEDTGVDLLSIHTLRSQRAASMLSDVRQLVGSGGGPEGGLDHANQDGVTLLHIAVASGYREVVRVLLEGGADPHPHDNHFWTPLHLAAKYGQTSIVIQLLRHRGNPTLMNCKQEKPSDLAASESILELLLQGEESWLKGEESWLKDPAAPPPAADPRQEEAEHSDLSPPLKSLSPLGLPISKRDGLLERWAMFRDAGGALSRHPSLDSGLDGPYGSGASKLEQVKLTPPAPNDDLASLSELTDSSLLYEMTKRFGNDQIYRSQMG